MSNNNVTLIIIKGGKVFIFERNTCESGASGHPTDQRTLKKMYPEALIREYSDPRLSRRLKSMVDKVGTDVTIKPPSDDKRHDRIDLATQITRVTDTRTEKIIGKMREENHIPETN